MTQQTALNWYDRGFTPIPCYRGTKRPATQWKNWQLQRPPRILVKHWFKTPRNIALLTGPGDLVVLDFDSLVAYHKWKHKYPESARSYTVNTPRPGKHVYFIIDKPTTSMYLDEVEVKGMRGMITAPPSVHPNGKQYEVGQDGDLVEISGIREVIEMGDLVEKEGDPTISAGMHSSPTRSLNANDLISRIKSSMGVLDVLNWFTIPYPSSSCGRWFVMRCPHPAHLDKNPSFWADTVNNRCACFSPRCASGQPSRSMDVFELWGWLHGILNNGDAIRALAREVGEL